MYISSFCYLLIFPILAFGIVEKIMAEQSSPEGVAKASFSAIQQMEFTTIANLTHPQAKERFKELVASIIESDDSPSANQFRQLLEPLDTREKVKAATADEVFLTFLKSSLGNIPGAQEMLKSAKLEILGEIEETPEKVHVITRTLLPRPKPVTCQKHEGKWYQMLDADVMRNLELAHQMSQQKKDDVLSGVANQEMKLSNLRVLGHVADGEDRAQVLCRVEMETSGLKINILGCYPVSKGETAWEHRNDKDTEALAAALKQKWGT